LARTHHRYAPYAPSTVVRDGNSVGGTYYTQRIPCPNCGEKQPLRQFTDTFIGTLGFVAAIAIPAVILYYAATAIGNHKISEINGSSKFGPTSAQMENSKKYKRLVDALHSGHTVTMVTTATVVVADQRGTICTVPKGRRVPISDKFLLMVAQDIWAVQNFFADLCPGSAEQEPRDDRHLKSFQGESPEIE
jgi:hypothetical protein